MFILQGSRILYISVRNALFPSKGLDFSYSFCHPSDILTIFHYLSIKQAHWNLTFNIKNEIPVRLKPTFTHKCCFQARWFCIFTRKSTFQARLETTFTRKSCFPARWFCTFTSKSTILVRLDSYLLNASFSQTDLPIPSRF